MNQFTKRTSLGVHRENDFPVIFVRLHNSEDKIIQNEDDGKVTRMMTIWSSSIHPLDQIQRANTSTPRANFGLGRPTLIYRGTIDVGEKPENMALWIRL